MNRLKKNIIYFLGLYLTAVLFFAWGAGVYKFQIFPFRLIQPIYTQVVAFFLQNHHDSFFDVVRLDHQEVPSNYEFAGFRKVDTNFHDDGFLLISGYSKSHSQTVITLFDIAKEQVVHTWVPHLESIFAVTPNFDWGPNNRMGYRSQHPLLMQGGDLIVGSGEGPLVRIDPCGRPRWVIERQFHHSIELDSKGNIVAPIVMGVIWQQDNLTKDANGFDVRNDGIAIVSPDGIIKAEYSVSTALLANGYQGLVYGVGVFEDDRFHLNDAQPLRGGEAAKGVLLSIRNLSSVALFVPETGAIEWLKTGPWITQHDINDLGDGRFSIFGNNYVRYERILGGHSEIYLFNPTTGQVETPYSYVLKEIKMASTGSGRVRILDNGDAFIEQSTDQRLLRISDQQVRWEYVHSSTYVPGGENITGYLHWSRYLPLVAVNTNWLETLSCE